METQIDTASAVEAETEQAGVSRPCCTLIREVRAHYHGRRRRGPEIETPEDVWRFLKSNVTQDNAREHFIVLHCNGAHAITSFSVASIGTANATFVHPREVFQTAILVGAVAIVIAHNHPSESLVPSDADREITAKLKDAGKLLGITVLDHVIFCDSGYRSFTEQGWM